MVKNRMKRFFKKYGYYFVGALLLVAIGITTAYASLGRKSGSGVIDVGTEPLTFRLPMNNAVVLKEYTEDHIFNSTLNQYRTHRAYSITSEDLKVFAVARGTVTEIGKSFELGNYIVITHENGLKSFYASMADDVLVSANSQVEKGQALGFAANTAENFSRDGNHLLFQMYKQNELINPATYLNFSDK